MTFLPGQEAAGLEARLDDFDREVRHQALARLKEMADRGDIPVSGPRRLVNLHCHSFFSYNAHGYSPSRIAWEAYKEGLEAVGTVEFDTLDGMWETLKTGDMLGIRSCVGMETRVFVREYADKVINSPREPGISYWLGCGFYRRPEPGSSAAGILQGMATGARQRNIAMIEKINDFLGEVRLDYEQDVLPLTPRSNATERHMLKAYDMKAREVFGNADALARFWTKALGAKGEDIPALLETPHLLHELMRARLMKHGGPGYAQPGEGSFPGLEEVIGMIRSCGALPGPTWLDGTNPGEEDPCEVVEFLVRKGAVALNIIPQRNITSDDPARKELLVRNLHAVVKAARELDVIIVSGTEMNRHGQPFADDLARPELAPIAGDIIRGAHVLYGHTLLARTIGLGYQSHSITQVFGDDRKARADFFEKVGIAVRPGPVVLEKLQELGTDMTPQEVLRFLTKLGVS